MTSVAALHDLTGKVAVVTGGSRGIGRAIVQTLAEAGRLDVLVNNAGMSPLYPSLDAVSEELFDKTLAVINQYLAAGLIDELQLHIVPLTLGAGTRLFEGVPPVTFEQVRSRAATSVTHVTYGVLS